MSTLRVYRCHFTYRGQERVVRVKAENADQALMQIEDEYGRRQIQVTSIRRVELGKA